MKYHRHAGASIAVDNRTFARDSGGVGADSGSATVAAFAASMPERYRQEFGVGAIRRHAQISMARGRRPVHADRFLGADAMGPGLCVVANDTRGLLALISAALMLEGLDITRADAYTRRASNDEFEAVDLFWVRSSATRMASGLEETEIVAVRATLRELLRRGEARKRVPTQLAASAMGNSETNLRFRCLRGARSLTLELESDDRPGLLAVVSAALAAEGVQILDSRIRTHGQRVHDYFDIVESDGTRPSGVRLQRIELAVLTALERPESLDLITLPELV